jgi:Tfp pilus assembly protein PilV
VRKAQGFTLAEAMLAIMFISIALFGYVSLHIRIIYSGTKLESRQAMHEKVGDQLNAQIASTRVSGGSANATTSSGVFNSGPYNSTGAYSTGQTIPYVDESSTASVNGLPPNLYAVNASTSWTDRNGVQNYFVDTYERQVTTGW